MKCDECGHSSEDEMWIGPDPYDEEINEKVVERRLCDECYQERLYEI